MVSTTSKQQLHTLLELMPDQAISVIYEILVRFIPTDVATGEEIEAIKQGRADFENGQFYSSEEVKRALNKS